MRTLGTADQAQFSRHHQVKGMVISEEVRALSTVRAQDLEAVLMLVSSFLLGALLFLALL